MPGNTLEVHDGQNVAGAAMLNLPAYPINIAPSFAAQSLAVHEAEATAHPVTHIQQALLCWNRYCTTHDEGERAAFLRHARWLVENATVIDTSCSGWPVATPHPTIATRGKWLSASIQGCALSVLVRAYQLTQDSCFLAIAQRAADTFARDILDGGVSVPLGKNEIFFEDVAIYPAAHHLDGCVYGLLGLYDYCQVVADAQVQTLAQQVVATLARFVSEFDAGFWTYTDLRRLHLSTSAYLAQQIHLLATLNAYFPAAQFTQALERWRRYRHKRTTRLRYYLRNSWDGSKRAILQGLRSLCFPKGLEQPPVRVCIPLNSYATGGILTVLRGVAQVTTDIWHTEYLTRYIGIEERQYKVHTFGSTMMAPWQFPTIWVYLWDGFWKLFALLRSGASYHILLPQDGVFTAAFCGLLARLAGIRTVCIDHANLTLTDSTIYRAERKMALAAKPLPRRIMSSILLRAYWPTLRSITRIAARTVDHFLIPGVAEDGINEICRDYGIPQSHITRFNSMIDLERHHLLTTTEQAQVRLSKGLPADAIVVAIICRLSPEKGLEIALESIDRACATLAPEDFRRLRVVIAGDGPSRQELEAEVKRRHLEQTCVFWGDIAAGEVITLLAISHIFLYTSTRGACMPMAVLEAMASECAVIATTQPIANEVVLADERGIIVQPGDMEGTTKALLRLINNPEECQRMGQQSRHYIAVEHSPAMFRRMLQRATCWSDLDSLLSSAHKITSDHESKENNDSI